MTSRDKALAPSAITFRRDGRGPALVLLHCLGVDHRFWDFAAPLADAFTLIRYDLPGHGASAVPGHRYGIADLSAQLAERLEAEQIGRAHVAGISLGGLIAQHLAASRPEMVDRLVLIDTTPRYTDELRAMWDERAATARERGVAPMIDALLAIWFSPGAIARDIPAVRYVRETLARTPGEGYARACEALKDADLRALVARIAAPTLVLCGEDDIASFRDAARFLASAIPDARLAWIAGARHASVIEHPAPALRLMRDFLGHRAG